MRTASQVSEISVPIYASDYYTGTLGLSGGVIDVGDMPGGTTCGIATIQPTPIHLLSSHTTSCNNPLLVGEDAMPVTSISPVGSNFGSVHIAFRDPSTGATRVGPVVMRYGNFSDTRPEWTYGGGYLWLYDVGTEADPARPTLPAEVLRISLTTGKVLAAVRMPPTDRVLLAANEDGLWVASGPESGWPSGSEAPQLLYFVGKHASHPEVVSQTGRAVNWLVASGHSAWASVAPNSPSGAEQIVTFGSNTLEPLNIVNGPTNEQLTNIGEGPADAPPVQSVPGFDLIGISPGWLGSVGRRQVAPTSGAHRSGNGSDYDDRRV